jgi:dienelactone hydrolase
MQSHLYFDDNAPGRPGVLVFPEALGLSQHAKNQAECLAGLGYILRLPAIFTAKANYSQI